MQKEFGRFARTSLCRRGDQRTNRDVKDEEVTCFEKQGTRTKKITRRLNKMKERSYYLYLENSVFSLFRDRLSEEIDILSSVQLSQSKRPDLTISRGEVRLAIVDIRSENALRKQKREIENWITCYAYREDFRYAIIAVEDKEFWIKDCFLNNNDEFKKLSLDAICHILETIRNPYLVPGKEYRDAVFEKIEECLNDKEWKGDKERKSSLPAFKEKHKAMAFMRDETRFFFNDESIEDELFECFIKAFEGKKVCRYTSLSSLFRTLNEGKQSMCGIAGMNDKSECTYADDYLRASDEKELLRTKTIYDAEVENNYFILSCMDEQKYDDLTMWRSYGDNTKGVNILYNVDNTKKAQFKLYYIDYAEKSGDDGHISLNIIKKLLGLTVEGRKFKLRRWNEWKHFFKPNEYKDEKEIRLLYNKKEKPADKWILTSDYQIACPFVLFRLQDFPLVIEEVKLGPNSPEIEANRLQLRLMIQEKLKTSKNKSVVQTSGIRTYRLG